MYFPGSNLVLLLIDVIWTIDFHAHQVLEAATHVLKKSMCVAWGCVAEACSNYNMNRFACPRLAVFDFVACVVKTACVVCVPFFLDFYSVLYIDKIVDHIKSNVETNG